MRTRTVRSLERRIRTLPLDGETPDLAVDGFREMFGATLWCAHRMERTATGFAPAFLEQSGWTVDGVRRYRPLLSTPSVDMPFLYDPERPPRSQRNRVLVLGELNRVVGQCRFAGARKLLAALDLQFVDQVRVIVCDGPELLGWFGGFRDAPFTLKEGRALERLLPALRTSLLWRRRLSQARLARAGLDAAMNAIGCPAFLVRRNHSITHANDTGEPLLHRRGRSLEADLSEALTSGRAEAIAVRGAGIPEHEIVILRDTSPRSEAVMTKATETWSLSPRQREVLGLLICGDSNKTIATKLRCAEVTVEFHVTALLRKARMSSRGELTARVWSGMLDGAYRRADG